MTKKAVAGQDSDDLEALFDSIASASDGYKVVFSWSELFNSPIGDGVLVMFEKDGNPIGDEEGRLALISTKDIRTGSRHVKWLNDIEVRKVVE